MIIKLGKKIVTLYHMRAHPNNIDWWCWTFVTVEDKTWISRTWSQLLLASGTCRLKNSTLL